jgi:PKD repeat protein
VLQAFDITGDGLPVRIGSLPLAGRAGRVSVTVGLAFVRAGGRGLLIVDTTNPTELALLGIVPDEEWGIGVEDRLYTTADGRGLRAHDTSGCSAAAPTADFLWQPHLPALGEEVAFIDVSAGSPISWLWDFGDGDTSSERHPRHTYAGPGDYTVSLTVDNQVGTDTVAGEVTVVSIASPSRRSYVIPAAAHGAGKANTQWRSDLVLEPRYSSASVAAFFMKRGQDNSLQPGRRLILPRSSTPLVDVVATLFGEDDATGAIYLAADTDLRIASRTHTLSGEGTYGQFIPAVDGDGTLESPMLMQLTQNRGFRTNLGLVNLEEHQIEVAATLYAADSTPLGTVTYSVEPFGHLQIDEFITGITSEPLDDGYVRLDASIATLENRAGAVASHEPAERRSPSRASSPVAFVAYASTIDNVTGDPVFMLPSTPSQNSLWIPAVAHVEGRNGTVWRTDLEVCSVASTDARFRLELLESDRTNPDPRSETFTLESGTCARYSDVVQDVFGTSTTGALAVVPETGFVTASSRTSTRRADGGTYGQYIAAVHDSEVVDVFTTELIQLAHSADPTRGFRTNLGLVNGSPFPIEVLLIIQTHDMVTLDERNVSLRPHEHRQLNQVLRGISQDDLENVRITVRNPFIGSRLIVYASVVDNVTGDAVFIPGQ